MKWEQNRARSYVMRLGAKSLKGSFECQQRFRRSLHHRPVLPISNRVHGLLVNPSLSASSSRLWRDLKVWFRCNNARNQQFESGKSFQFVLFWQDENKELIGQCLMASSVASSQNCFWRHSFWYFNNYQTHEKMWTGSSRTPWMWMILFQVE